MLRHIQRSLVIGRVCLTSKDVCVWRHRTCVFDVRILLKLIPGLVFLFWLKWLLIFDFWLFCVVKSLGYLQHTDSITSIQMLLAAYSCNHQHTNTISSIDCPVKQRQITSMPGLPRLQQMKPTREWFTRQRWDVFVSSIYLWSDKRRLSAPLNHVIALWFAVRHHATFDQAHAAPTLSSNFATHLIHMCSFGSVLLVSRV